MANLGTFTRNHDDNTFTGSIRTLTFNVKARLVPADKTKASAPDYRVLVGQCEIGAVWTKIAKESGAEYQSLKIDDPSFAAPIYASLMQQDDGSYHLIWSR